jgi:flagellar hook-length control protein FliK
MMALDTNIDSTKPQIGLLGIVKSEDVTDDKFSQMLKELGFGEGKKDEKDSPKLSTILSSKIDKSDKTKESKSDKVDLKELLSSLNDEEKVDLKFFNPQVIKTLTISEVKDLINDAKNYLKTKLQTLIDEKEMPRTLKSLVESAKKFGIEVEKITFKEISPEGEKKISDHLKEMPIFKDKEVAQKKVFIPNDLTKNITPIKQNEEAQKSDHKENLQSILNSKKSTKEETQVVKVVSENATQKVTEIKSVDPKQQEISKIVEVEVKPIKNSENKNSSETIKTIEVVKNSISNEAKNEISTQSKIETKENLPKSKDDIVKNLESLLGLNKKDDEKKGDTNSKNSNDNKESSLSTNSMSKELNIKTNEAKQMLGNFSTSLKEAADNYKPPFTKLTMMLNPEKLGSVEVTIVQRGNNLHINLGSNSNALNILSQNIADLKTQLANNGMTNATLNLTTQVVESSSNSSNTNNNNSNQSSQQLNQNGQNGSNEQQNQNQNHNQQQNQRNRVIRDIYESLNLSENESVTQIEIILPRYV